MKRRDLRRNGPPALELMEEAVHVLRQAPARALAFYYLGSVPFLLGLMYFWADMSQSAFASQRCATAAWAMVGLFIWMKTWQAMFAGVLKSVISGVPEPEWSWRQWLRIAVNQTTLQSTGLVLLPLAALITIPFAWTFAFYQSVTVVDDGTAESPGALIRKAGKLSTQWPMQNHVLLATLALCLFFVFLNLAIAVVNIPALLSSLFGIETTFSMSIWTLLNTTFLAALCALTYLCLDPLIKAVYALRCFYGESLNTGADLRVALRRTSAERLAGGLLVIALIFSASAAIGAEKPATGKSVALATESKRLDKAIDEVISQREYAWRLPRGAAVEEEKGVITLFLESVMDMLKKAAHAVQRLIYKLMLWLDKVFTREQNDRAGGGSGETLMWSLRILIFVLLCVSGCALGILIYRWWKQRPAREEVIAEAVTATPDLRDENITASQLPEDEWLKLALQMLERGERRLAIRAYYLASLAHLGGRELIQIARFKSNHDYELELRRRARPLPDLVSAFGVNVSIFDMVWYGTHEVDRELLSRFQGNLERIRTC